MTDYRGVLPEARVLMAALSAPTDGWTAIAVELNNSATSIRFVIS